MAYHCRYGTANRQQHVITIQETTQPRLLRRQLPACLSEQSRVTRKVTPHVLLAEAERVLETGNGPATPQDCPRCALTLTYREWQVLSAIRRCMRPYQVAIYLNLSIKTVSAHKCNAMNKLGFHRNSELYHWLRQGGLEQEIREYL
nr:LuxR C-terminal-related transcriptional regulator [Serratia ureilytica]